MPRFELGHKLLRKRQLDLRVAGFPKHSQKTYQIERRTVFHHGRSRRISHLLRGRVRVLNLTKRIDQFVLERIFSRKNTAIRNSSAQTFGREIPFLGDDAEKLIVGFHDETLHVIALLRSDGTGAVEHVLKLAAFKSDRPQTDLIEKLFVIQGLNDNADAPGNGGLIRH